jgi:hypothetical protein
MEFLNPKIKICYGIEIELQGADAAVYRFCKIEIQGKELNIQEKRAFNKIEELISALDKKIPLAISFTGKSILTKSIENKSESDVSLAYLFPGVNAEDFYQQVYENVDKAWFSICRKEVLDHILDSFIQRGLDILAVSLGAFTVTQVINQLNAYDGEIIFNGYKLIFDKEYSLKAYEFKADLLTSFKIKIGITDIEESYVISYSVAYQLAMHHLLELNVISNYQSNDRLEKYIVIQKLKTQILVGLFGIFILLFVNVAIFQWLEKQNKTLAYNVGQQSSSMELNNKLLKGNEAQKIKLKQLGWSKGYSFAILIDDINKNLPSEIKVVRLKVNPLEKINDETAFQPGILINDETAFQPGILINAKTKHVIYINEFMEKAKLEPWVKNIYLDKLTTSEDNLQNFEIWIKY